MQKCFTTEKPNYGFTNDNIAESVYRKLYNWLDKRYELKNYTDTNDEVCFSFVIKSENEKVYLELSMVGRYAVIFKDTEGKNGAEIIESIGDAATDLEKKIGKADY